MLPGVWRTLPPPPTHTPSYTLHRISIPSHHSHLVEAPGSRNFLHHRILTEPSIAAFSPDGAWRCFPNSDCCSPLWLVACGQRHVVRPPLPLLSSPTHRSPTCTAFCVPHPTDDSLRTHTSTTRTKCGRSHSTRLLLDRCITPHRTTLLFPTCQHVCRCDRVRPAVDNCIVLDCPYAAH